MKRYFISISMSLLLAFTPLLSQNRKLSLDPQKAEWFKEAKFGMFIHFGLYSMLEGEYKGTVLTPAVDKVKYPHGQTWYAEWIQMRLGIPSEEYKPLADSFNPVNFDADQWIAEAKNAGMKYFVITSKHHDGFALWDTKVSDFKVTNSPFKRDILAELVAACRKYDIKYGFYYSHWQDWEYPGGAMPDWFPKVPEADFEKYWQEKSLPQVKELLVNFDPDLLWFDTWDWETHITDERRDELIALVRANSDKCLINGRISYLNPGENIDFLEMHDNQYPDKILEKPWQTPATMVHSWGWHAKDYNWKSSAQMLGYLVNNVSKGGNYLLNVGPKPDGSFPLAATRRLREMGAWLVSNGEAVYGTHPVKIPVEDGVYLTQKNENNRNYIYVNLTKPTETLTLPVKASDITKCEVLEYSRPINYRSTGNSSILDIPQDLFKDCTIQVLKLEVKSPL
ncbi:MAG: alpha-L-fucosidase [Dysgonomonas sp.]|nr:alpha-L-fucosidase [Dysgonomonas sp.]